MTKKSIILIGAAMLLSLPCAARQKKGNVLDIKESITDNSIIYPESFETDTQKLLESWYMTKYTATDDRYKTMPDVKVTDREIMDRLQALPTIIELPFNQIVRAYIDRYLGSKSGRAQVAATLGLSNYYMPIFEQALEQEGLPLELKYLPVIESSLDPNAVSRHGATGLWQFMLGAAKGLGMEVNSLVDERRDPYISSEKAAAFLKELYATYGDWTLAIAAYNCGPSAVNKAIRRAGGDPKDHNFWSIYNYLPAETRGYVPMFIAANYVMNYYPKHNISPVLATKPLVTDTVAVTSRLHFNQISNVLDIPVEELRILNPQFRADIIPASASQPYYLILPSQQVHAYIMSEEEIHNYDADKYAQRTVAEPGVSLAQETMVQPSGENDGEVTADDRSGDEVAEVLENTPAATGYKTITHKVGPDDTLASIAEKYNVSPKDIKSWNSLRRNALRVGQQLRIQVPADSRAESNTPSAKVNRRQEKNTSASSSHNKEKKEKADSSDRSGKKNAKDKKSGKNKKDKKSKKKEVKPTDHTVKSGENLSTIAKKYGVSVEELKKANKKSDDMLHPGDKVKLPKAAKSSSKKGKSNASKKSSKKKGGKKRRR